MKPVPTGCAGLEAYTRKCSTSRKQPSVLHHARPHPGVIRAVFQLHVHPEWFNHNHPFISQDESVYRCLVCLGNTLHASHTQEEVIIIISLNNSTKQVFRFVNCSSLWTPVIWSVVASPGEERSQLQLLKSFRCSNQETTSTWTDAPATHFTDEIYKITNGSCWMKNIPT